MTYSSLCGEITDPNATSLLWLQAARELDSIDRQTGLADTYGWASLEGGWRIGRLPSNQSVTERR